MLNISDEEKQSLLAQHQQPYNGYQTLQLPQHDNLLRVYDAAGDKHGVQVTTNGNVRTYSNVNLREGKEMTCECGGMMYEGECMECGYMMEGTAKLQDKFDYVEEDECMECWEKSMEEEVSASLQEPYSEIDFGNYDFDSGGPEQFGDDDDEILQHNYKEPYEFDSEGPLATSGVFREIEDPEEVENIKESIKESLNWFKRFSNYN